MYFKLQTCYSEVFVHLEQPASMPAQQNIAAKRFSTKIKYGQETVESVAVSKRMRMEYSRENYVCSENLKCSHKRNLTDDVTCT